MIDIAQILTELTALPIHPEVVADLDTGRRWYEERFAGLGSFMFQFLESEVLPRLAGEQPINSFPFVEFSALAFTGACI